MKLNKNSTTEQISLKVFIFSNKNKFRTKINIFSKQIILAQFTILAADFGRLSCRLRDGETAIRELIIIFLVPACVIAAEQH